MIKAVNIPRVTQQPEINYKAKGTKEKESEKHSSGLNPLRTRYLKVLDLIHKLLYGPSLLDLLQG